MISEIKNKNKREPKKEIKLENFVTGKSGSVFDAKTDSASSDMYFHYYGQLIHQQNMLQVFLQVLIHSVLQKG